MYIYKNQLGIHNHYYYDYGDDVDDDGGDGDDDVHLQKPTRYS